MYNHLVTLSNIVKPQNLLTHEKDMAPYAIDWRNRYHGFPLAVALPKNQDEVIQLVRFCAQHKIPMVPQGGNTSTCGGATPDKTGSMLVIATKRMNRILSVDCVADTITTEVGVTLLAIQKIAQHNQRFFPLALASQGSCQIGGNLSTNAGGTNTMRYGTMRNLVLSLEAVLPNGEVLSQLHQLKKDTTGLDVKQLFIGAEGTLGIVTAATLKLFAQPNEDATALIGLTDFESAMDCLASLKNLFGELLTSCEIISKTCFELVKQYQPYIDIPLHNPWTLLIELTDHLVNSHLKTSLIDWLQKNNRLDSIVAQSAKERAMMWKLRENIPEAEKQAGNIIKHDIALPISQLPQFLKTCQDALKKTFPAIECILFGHMGDGSIHYNVRGIGQDIMPHENAINEIVYSIVQDYSGTIAAEHGIGQLKKQQLAHYKDPVALRMMRQIKTLIDPAHLMNPHCLY